MEETNKDQILRFIDELWERFKDSSYSHAEQQMHLNAIESAITKQLGKSHINVLRHHLIMGKKETDWILKLEKNLNVIKELIKNDI